MHVVCLDLEGVLVPEIWINVSEITAIPELAVTTRDISDYDVLMKMRIDIMARHGLLLCDIQNVIASMDPLEGAFDFFQTLRSKVQVIILSDTFEEFAYPLMRKLAWPTLFCNNLVVDSGGAITGYNLRQDNGKREAVKALQSINMKVFAAGDSYNDVTMLQAADHGVLFRSPGSIRKEFPMLPAVTEYDELLRLVEEFTA